jgi:ABC-type Fe3+-hydroxamate transport system substrate-binding protein
MALISLHTYTPPDKPLRIVSLVPSQTELLADLGLDSEVVGITKFCVHPQTWWRQKKRIGGTKTVDIPAVFALQPNLILANKEENVREQVLEMAAKVPTYVSEVGNLPTALHMIEEIGLLTQRQETASQLVSEIKEGFGRLMPMKPVLSAAYLIWKDPWMTIGGDTFINHMMDQLGLSNIFADRLRYPSIDLQTLAEKSPEVLLLSSEPYPFAQKHVDQLQPLLPHTRIVLVDGEMFSWHGSRLRKAPDYFGELQRYLE